MAERRRVLIAEEAIRDHSGHWAAYNCTIAAAFEALGWEATVAGSRELAPGLAAAGVRPVFSESRWDTKYDTLPPTRRRLWTLRHNLRLAADMDRFLRAAPPFDLVFAGNVTLAHVTGWWRVICRHPDKVRRLALMFVQDAGSYPPGGSEPVFPPQARLLRLSIRLLRPLVREGRVILSAETEAARHQYERLTGLPFHLLPHPVALPELPSLREDPPLLVAPGFARYEKGSDLLQSAWMQFRREHPDTPARLLLQWGGDFTLPSGEVETFRLAGLPDVSCLRDALDEPALAALLQRASGVVMPYRRSSYYSRLSRVVIEAMQAGLPVLHSADTWLESAVRAHGAGLSIPAEDPRALANSLHLFINKLPVLRLDAAARAKLARDAYSPGAFAGELARLCGIHAD